jgi:hypothetical protein
VIHEVDEALRSLIASDALVNKTDVLFEAPTKEWAARRNAPTVNLFLYDVRENLTRRQTGRIEEHDEHGVVVGWRQPPRWFDLSYLATAWTKHPQDEHRLLSALLGCFVRHETIPPQRLVGSLASLPLTVSLQAARPLADNRSVTDVWSSLGGELKASIDLQVAAPLIGERDPAGPPVTDALVARTSQTDGAPNDARRLRYDDPATTGPHAGAATFGARQSRELPRSRRIRRSGR